MLRINLILILMTLALAVAGCVNRKPQFNTVTPLPGHSYSTNQNLSQKQILTPKETSCVISQTSQPVKIIQQKEEQQNTVQTREAIPEWIQIESFKSTNIAVSYITESGFKIGVITAGDKVIKINQGSRMAEFNGILIDLGKAPRWENGSCFVHYLDATKTLKPLLNTQSILKNTNCVIVVDPGHGGNDPGTKNIVTGKHEKDYTLDVARRLKSHLENRGFKVFLTRTNDIRVERLDRIAFADRVNADLFISIHFNSFSQSPAVKGIETYCITPRGITSTLNRGFNDDLTMQYPNNDYDELNITLAARIHKSLIAATSTVDRGVRHARFLEVLQSQKRPAVLVEAGYLSNPVEARLIESPEYRDKLAEAIARAIE